MWILTLTSVTGTGNVYDLSPGHKYKIGRSTANLILNDDTENSEIQAYLRPYDNHVELIDAGSNFGTYYNENIDLKIRMDKNASFELKNGDSVCFGSLKYKWILTKTDVDDEMENMKVESYNCNTIVAIILLIILAILIALITNQSTPKTKIQSNNEKKMCSFLELKKSFPNQNDDLWNSITIGIEGILNKNPATPGVYLFLHENNYSTKDLIEKIANTSASCFDPNLQPLKLVTEDFISDDYGIVIEKYKKNIKNGGVLIVANLDEIPPEGAQALHSICDSYSPIVERVVIFLTLIVNPDENGKLLSIAENKLNHLWGATIEQNILEPLISRVTESVIRLFSE